MNHALTRALAGLAILGVATAQSPTYRTAAEPRADAALSAVPGGFLFSIPGVATDFILSGGCQFVQLPDGTARLTGRVRSNSRIYAGLLVDLQFSGRVQPGDPSYPPVGSPDLQMLPGAYTPIGPIDPYTFVYYTAASGTMHGVRELDGARIALQLTGPAAQVGVGANNRNGLIGLAASFAVTVLQNPTPAFGPTSTATLSAILKENLNFPTTHVMVDHPRSPLPTDRAMVLPGLPGEYLFVPAATFIEYTDGHTELHGMLARIDALDDQWQLDLVLGGRTDPGQPNCPPPGAPTLGLYPAEYSNVGGTIDPSHWHYYTTATGTLTGQGTNLGGLIALGNSTPFQFGGGANQANTYFGYYGTCTATVLQSPTSHAIALTGDAQLHGLNGNFPVLPLPSLTTPAVPLTLSTLTDQGFVIAGQHLAWINAVGVGSDYLTAQTPSNWYRGYFRILDDNHIEVHPVPGHVPGSYSVRAFNPAINTNSLTASLTAPTEPTLVTEPTLRLGNTHHMYVHQGSIPGTVVAAVAFSTDLLPSVQPGFLALDIGNQFTTVDLLPPVMNHDPLSGIGTFSIGPVPASVIGAQLHFQAIVLELGNHVYPLRVTNHWTTSYTN